MNSGKGVLPSLPEDVVAARPDELKGQVPTAYAIEKPPGQVTAQQPKKFFLRRGIAHLHPGQAYLIDEMPLTSARMVNREGLRQYRDAAPIHPPYAHIAPSSAHVERLCANCP